MDSKKNKKPICILVMGGPASGKGTYCKKLSEQFGMIHLSIGDILREERQKDNEQGRFLDYHMKEFETSGKLMPPEVVAQFLYMALYNNGWEKNVYLIDGFVKAKGGYDCWQKMFAKIVDMKFVLYLECGKDTMLARMTKRSETSGRLDDNDKIFLKRVDTFLNRTYPCVELFAADGLVRKVNTEDTMENVYAKIKEVLLEFFPDFIYA
jgi:adenylate kinase family enzyme